LALGDERDNLMGQPSGKEAPLFSVRAEFGEAQEI